MVRLCLILSATRQAFLTACVVSLFATAATSTAQEAAPAAAATPPASKFDQAVKEMKKVEGMWPMYYKEQRLYVDLKNNQFNKDFLILTSIAKGVSSGMVIGGMTWGDDVLWNFRKVGDKVHVLRKNVRFKARPGSPEANAVKVAYTDSVLYALPIVSESPGGQLVDVTRIFLSDDEQIGRFLGASFVLDRSTIDKVKAFPNNIELQVAAVYQGSGSSSLETVPDPRGMQVQVHYSISTLPQTGYKPRKADDRVGYFMAVTKDFSDMTDDRNFVRYITRWDLQKADPKAKLSPPKEPIIFYMEKTLPISLRPIVRSGIEEWNKAFEKIGYANAIEVRQQRDDDEWDPEDVTKNTFRWITAEAGFAMGPSRVNPMTGQILDADIIFDASFLRYWRQEYENFSAQTAAELVLPGYAATPKETLPFLRGEAESACQLSVGMQHQMGFAAAALLARGMVDARAELPQEFLEQALKEVTMHEVGHTLGLRHNFKASAWKSLAEIQDPSKPAAEPTVASVMDYSPVNIAPPGAKQTSYYTTTIGPYDHWAIEYGYKEISGDESAELLKIAARSAEPGLDYATDEDTRSSDPDPLVNRFDLGKDPIEYARQQVKVVSELTPKLMERAVQDGEGYQRVRQAFGLLLSEYWRTVAFAARLPGGVYVHRDHKGDPQGRAPFKVVDAAQQRAALKLMTDAAFASPTYDPNLLNSLASTRWSHWGITEPSRIDYPIHETVLRFQDIILSQLLSGATLSRIHDSEVKIAADQDAYTVAEHLKLVVDGVFGELASPPAGEFTNRKPFLPSYRRNLQRSALKQFSSMVTPAGGSSSLLILLGGGGSGGVPSDAKVVARMHLHTLKDQITAALAKADLKLDDYSRAHLLDLQTKLNQVLNASLTVNSVN
ncbi:MAG: zinc-dependent metalloprotease [Planctomycetaceae bacterium]|nr:zinc-dependent metalloprotease [Planctomycetaceae bacterium]